MRVFLDANILFSASKSSGAVRAFLAELRRGGHTLVADGYVMGEARRNLEAKFPAALVDFKNTMAIVEAFTSASVSLENRLMLDLPEKDRPVLAAAIQHRCHALLTGDRRHFGSLYGLTIKGVEIHSAASLAIKLRNL